MEIKYDIIQTRKQYLFFVWEILFKSNSFNKSYGFFEQNFIFS